MFPSSGSSDRRPSRDSSGHALFSEVTLVEVEPGVHVEVEFAIGVDVGPKERGQASAIFDVDALMEFRCFQDSL